MTFELVELLDDELLDPQQGQFGRVITVPGSGISSILGPGRR